MKKRILSIALAGVLTASVAATAVVSASASVDPEGRYVPSPGITDTQTVYFYMPNDWINEYTHATGDSAGAYWWTGSDPCGDVAGETEGPKWPGYKIWEEKVCEDGKIFSLTMPIDVGQIVFNNFFDGGEEKTDPKYTKAVQTANVPCEEYYEPGDSELYDEIYPDEEIYFDGMIYVCDRNKIVENPYNQKLTYGGEWYFYYGDGEYGYYKTKEEAVEKEVLQNKCYYSPKGEDPTEPTTEPTTADPSAPTEPTVVPAPTSATVAPTTPETTVAPSTPGQPSTDANSGTSDTATKDTSNNSVKTGDSTMLFVVLFSVVAAAGVAFFARKRIIG